MFKPLFKRWYLALWDWLLPRQPIRESIIHVSSSGFTVRVWMEAESYERQRESVSIVGRDLSRFYQSYRLMYYHEVAEQVSKTLIERGYKVNAVEVFEVLNKWGTGGLFYPSWP